MKSYRENELKSYVIANLLIYIIFCNGLKYATNTDNQLISLLTELLDFAIISSAIYSFVFVLDSVYSGNLKMRLVYLFSPLPGQTIFDKIIHNTKDIRFSKQLVEKYYEQIYSNMPNSKRQKLIYQNQQWYKIYHKYKDIDMVCTSARDFRLCRDMFVATLNIIIVYISLCYFSKIVVFNQYYLCFLFLMTIITNFASRNKGKKWTYNVIAHDLSEQNS